MPKDLPIDSKQSELLSSLELTSLSGSASVSKSKDAGRLLLAAVLIEYLVFPLKRLKLLHIVRACTG